MGNWNTQQDNSVAETLGLGVDGSYGRNTARHLNALVEQGLPTNGVPNQPDMSEGMPLVSCSVFLQDPSTVTWDEGANHIEFSVIPEISGTGFEGWAEDAPSWPGQADPDDYSDVQAEYDWNWSLNGNNYGMTWEPLGRRDLIQIHLTAVGKAEFQLKSYPMKQTRGRNNFSVRASILPTFFTLDGTRQLDVIYCSDEFSYIRPNPTGNFTNVTGCSLPTLWNDSQTLNSYSAPSTIRFSCTLESDGQPDLSQFGFGLDDWNLTDRPRLLFSSDDGTFFSVKGQAMVVLHITILSIAPH